MPIFSWPVKWYFIFNLKKVSSWALVAYTCHPTNLGSRDQEDHSSRSAGAKRKWDPTSKLPDTKGWWKGHRGRVPTKQYHQKIKMFVTLCFFNLNYYFYFVLLWWVGVHCDIYKDSYNVSNISCLNSHPLTLLSPSPFLE
jgi:hypothetical protein